MTASSKLVISNSTDDNLKFLIILVCFSDVNNVTLMSLLGISSAWMVKVVWMRVRNSSMVMDNEIDLHVSGFVRRRRRETRDDVSYQKEEHIMNEWMNEYIPDSSTDVVVALLDEDNDVVGNGGI